MKAAVIGYPIEHSKSPLIHQYWLKKHDISGTYEAIAIESQSLGAGIKQLIDQGYDGFNVTVPHKQAVMALCDEVDEKAQAIGAVNTVVIKESKLHGTNTDAFGFIENLKTDQPNFDFKEKIVCVLGAGGAARAIIYGLIEEGVKKIYLCNRTIEKAQELAKQFADIIEVYPWDEKENILDQVTLLVNTTSLGMTTKPELEINVSSLPKDALVTDIVYAPLITNLLKQAEAQNLAYVTGIGMLLHQARPAFEAWSGVMPDIDNSLKSLILS